MRMHKCSVRWNLKWRRGRRQAFSDCAVCGNYRYGNDDCSALVEAVPAGLRLCGNDGAVYTGKADDTGTGQYLFLRMCFPCTRLYYQGIRAGDEILFPLCCVAAAFVLGLFLMRRKNMLKKEAD